MFSKSNTALYVQSGIFDEEGSNFDKMSTSELQT